MFVGYRGENDELTARLSAAAGGTGQVVLVSGEPGIGKTRLGRELAETASARAIPACWGRATEDDGSPPYWPFRQIVRRLAGQHAPGPLAGDIAFVAPEVASGHSRPISSPAERFRVFEAVTGYLLEAAGAAGLLIVLDDLQWADPPTLQLLVHLTHAVADSRLMVLATYRDTETRGRHALVSALAALAREDTVTRIRLVGLTEAEVAAQLAALTEEPVAAEVVAAISRRTRGNPFFVAELGRLLPDHTAMPGAVRDAVRVRLHGLSTSCRDVLAAASVLGSEVEPATLAAVLDRPVDIVLAAFDEGMAAGMTSVSESDGWRFTHDLVRDAARLDVPTADRLGLHQRIATHLEVRADATTRAAEIAHHWLESLPGGDPAKATAWAERAADAAMDQLAWENAAGLYDRALRASPDLAPDRRWKILCGKGTAQLRQLDLVGAQQSLKLAARDARHAGDVEGIARVALAMEGITDPNWIATGKALCDEALAGLPQKDSPLRARLLAQRAGEAALNGEPGMQRFAEDALAMAERTGDPRALRAALRAGQVARANPGGVTDRLALGDRMLAIGLADHDDDAVLWGRLWRFDAFCMLGRIDEAEGELLPIGTAAARLRTPVLRWHHLRSQVAIAHGRGRFRQGRQLAAAALELVEPGAGETVVGLTAWLLATSASMIGEEQEILAEHADFFYHPPQHAATMVGAWHAECGRLDDARRCYQPGLIHEPLPEIRLLPMLFSFAVLARAFDDRPVAEAAYRGLLPYPDLILCGGAGVIIMHGSVQGALGIAAATLGRLDDAVEHLRAAVKHNESAGLPPFAALARLDLAKVLTRRRRPGDQAEAAALATVTAGLADDLEMRPLVRDARALATSLSGGAASPLTKREREVADLVAKGLTNKQIAASAHISVRTAETHVQHILAKLGLTNRSQLAARWTELSTRTR